MPAVKEIYWLAALFEGEGCFMVNTSAYMKIGMSDEDVINRVSKLLGKSYITRHYTNGHKSMYTVEISGSKAIQWMMTIYPIMGQRRQGKIREIIEIWKNHPLMGRGAGYFYSRRTHCKNGHEYTEENTRYYKDGRTGRVCRECNRLANIRFMEAQRARRA